MISYDVDYDHVIDFLLEGVTPTDFIRGISFDCTFTMRANRELFEVTIDTYGNGCSDFHIDANNYATDTVITDDGSEPDCFCDWSDSDELSGINIRRQAIWEIRCKNAKAEDVLTDDEMHQLKEFMREIAAFDFNYAEQELIAEEPDYACDSFEAADHLIKDISVTDFIRGSTLQADFRVLETSDDRVDELCSRPVDTAAVFDAVNTDEDKAALYDIEPPEIPADAVVRIRKGGEDATDVLTPEQTENIKALMKRVAEEIIENAEREHVGELFGYARFPR